MAGAMDENATEHFITCNVCYLQFDEDLVKPKLLPCSHTVCIQCLRVLYLISKRFYTIYSIVYLTWIGYL